MEQIKVFKFLEENKELLFPNKEYTQEYVENMLLAAPDSFERVMKRFPLRKPSTVQLTAIVSLDRYYLGDFVKALLKTLTFGCFGIWWIADIMSAKTRCRTYNCKKIVEAVDDPSVAEKLHKTDSRIDKTIQTVKTVAPIAKTLKDGMGEVRDTFNVTPRR